MTEEQLGGFVRALLATSRMQDLWQVKDRGMPVFAHSVDVTLLCIDAFPRWRSQHPEIDLGAVVIGSLVHDLTKLGAHHYSDRSHSRIMSDQPGVAVEAAVELLDEVCRSEGLALAAPRLELIKHIVASHHGYWGKIPPATPEALLVHRCDYHSATHHRLAPVDTNDILPLLSLGYRWAEVSAKLGVGRAVVKARLQESCKAEHVRDWVDLMPIWRDRGAVAAGTPDRLRQLERARLVIRLSRQAPDSLISRLHPLFTDGGALAAAGDGVGW